MRFYLSTLGCPRNQLDSDYIGEILEKKGIKQTFSFQLADFCLVNTCAFIEVAKEDSLEEIFSLIKTGKKVIVLGCLAQRYGKEISKEIPELKAVVSPDNYKKLPEILKKIVDGKKVISLSSKRTFFYQPEGKQSTFPYAYLKLTEGCSNRCSFCAIPMIRGSLRSASVKQVLKQAQKLLGLGYKEINLVGQDITAYGLDQAEPLLTHFLNKLAQIEGEFWIRLLYLNPLRVNEELLEAVACHSKILPYFDLSYQHASYKILKKMGRLYDKDFILNQVEKIRQTLSDSVIRATFMVGFPGETDKDFEVLLKLVEEASFDYVGVFEYSREEGTKAANMVKHVPLKVKRERKERLSFFADEISFKRLKKFLKKKVKVLIEAKEEGRWRGRFFAQAPEIDGEVLIKGKANVGSFFLVKLLRQEGFDFEGEVVGN